MTVTIILCTYNRCQRLARALDSVASSTVSDSVKWEVLVVDNNSTDQTREVAEEFSRSHPGHFRYCFEPKQGKSHALNAGIREARGDILAFLDDDVTVGPTWLQDLTAPLGSGEWLGSAGRILPERDFTPPRWLSLSGLYDGAPLALWERGLRAGPLNEPPFGTNMAFRRQAFETHGNFRTDLGPQPGSEIRSEDTEFSLRLLNAGERLYYQPSAVVYHSITEERVRKEYFLKWWFDKSRADIRVNGVYPATRWKVRGVPLYTLRRICVWTVRWLLAVKPSRRFDCKLNVWRNLGGAFEAYRQSLVPKETAKRVGRRVVL
jgi:glycosyltransferase involved in cell wall biosynthesis